MARKNDEEREKKVVNDAIQYWRGFSDAIEYAQTSPPQLDIKLKESKQLIEDYRDRLFQLRRRTYRKARKKCRYK